MHKRPFALMAVHAHPDDECIGTGGTLAKYVKQGVQTTVVFCTKGEEGDIQNPEFRAPKPGMSMGEIRTLELKNALGVLGIDSWYFLGYRDSGMQGTPTNNHPEAFAQADIDEAVSRLVDIIRDVKPHVIVTYNERGGYGHPDHIMANKITVQAFHRAGDPNENGTKPNDIWQPQKLYYTATPLERLKKRYQMAIERGEKPRMNPEFMGTPDDLITTAIDVEPFIQTKIDALSCHKSQMGPNNFFRQIPKEQRTEYFKFEHYVCVSGGVNGTEKEHGFFEGIA